MTPQSLCDPIACTGCAACAQSCPKGAISMREDAEGFRYPSIDTGVCVDCGICAARCPAAHDAPRRPGSFHMAWHRDADALRSSSSGGVFPALAEYAFRRGGVAFGAAKDAQTREVYHRAARNAEELEGLKLSKYYQSDVRGVYGEVRALLEAGEHVLFTGTACQIAGLLACLGDADRERLVTADVLCHGVASKKVIDGYLRSQERRFGKKVADFAFRVKDGDTGWVAGGGTRMRVTFADGSEYVAKRGLDTFFAGFNQNYFLRESCYRCKYCGRERVSDFTMADFWGCDPGKLTREQKLLGVSVLLCNTPKAEGMLDELRGSLEIQPIRPEEAVPHNRALSRPQQRPAIRDTFFAEMERRGYDPVVAGLNRKRFLKRRVKNVLLRILPGGISRRIMKTP